MMQEDTKEREQCVFAALETGVRLRGPQAGADSAGAVEQTIVRIEAESARIQAHDLSAVEAVFASQALALDTLFVQLARGSTYGGELWPEPLRLALRAQSQSRATLGCLLSFAKPPAHPRRAKRNFNEQTIANGNSPK